MSAVQAITDYLVDNGMEENEVDHFLKDRIFSGKSILDYIKMGEIAQAWYFVKSYMLGETW